MDNNSMIPATHQALMPYLIVKNAREFIAFMQKVFGAKETYRAMRDENTIMHAEIMIGTSTVMLADATEKYPERTAGMFIYVDNADETFMKALEAGSTVEGEMADQSYGRSGGVKDPFGNVWWVTSLNK
jgi:PhnB protein